MIEGRERLRLAFEARQAFRVSESVRQDLDRNLAAQRRVRRSHLPHSAFADPRRDVVDAEARAGVRGIFKAIIRAGQQADEIVPH